MAKILHSPQNQIILAMLRRLRETRHLRQTDLAQLIGRSQAMVSNVERGQRALHVIELREWLEALEADFVGFLSELDAELRQAGVTRITAALHKRRQVSARPTTVE